MRPPPVAPDAFDEAGSHGRGAPGGPLRVRSRQSHLFSTRELVKAVDGHPRELPKSLERAVLRNAQAVIKNTEIEVRSTSTPKNAYVYEYIKGLRHK